MRKLVITRGPQGSGKSRLLEATGLAPYAISPDFVRLLVGAPILTADGRLSINQDFNERTFAIVKQFAAERMARGEAMAVDATFSSPSDFKMLRGLAQRWRYEVACADFSDFPIDEAIRRDAGRLPHHRVGEFSIRRTAGIIAKNPLAFDDVETLRWTDEGSLEASFDRLKARVDGFMAEPVLDWSDREGVVHVGDLQGCLTVLTGPGGPLADGFRDDHEYVFVGDLLDRGIENGRVMRWFLDEAMPRSNVHLLWGNHEDHLDRWAAGEEAVSNEFLHRTLPQLKMAGVTHEDADAVCARAREFVRYAFRGERVLVTHAGLSTAPERPELVSRRQFSHGTGYWSDPVDSQFDRNAPEGWTQVHGHRNHGGVAVRATPRSFNLEDSVEHGGRLRTATLGAGGWSVTATRNAVFRPLKDRLALETKVSEARQQERRAYPAWTLGNGKEGGMRIDDATLGAMRAHTGVRERSSEAFPHVASLNFSKKIFYSKAWDEVTMKARGLFFDLDSHEIVARGYEKFFNVGERDETTMEALKDRLKFPIALYLKENGFLGNLGYDARNDRLFPASKSTPDGPFAEMFREILRQTVDESRAEGLRRYLRDHEASMTFEVIDPARDPHMIEYDAPKIVLLDVVRRSMEFERAAFPVVEEVGKRFGIETKRRAMTFKDWRSFEAWHARATSDVNYKVSGAHVEGLVIEDAGGFMTKVKLGYYATWKQLRGVKDRIVSAREKGAEFAWTHTRRSDGTAPSEEEVDLAHAFRDWCLDQDAETLKADVITLRKAFGRDFGMDAAPSRAASPA